MEERMYWVAWSRIPKFGGRRLLSLFEAFGSLEAAWHAPLRKLADAPDVGPTLAIEAVAWRKDREPGAELDAVSGPSHRVYTWVDAGYPEPLKTIPDPPPVLYVMGEFPDWSKAIGVVGMRKPSDIEGLEYLSFKNSVTEADVKLAKMMAGRGYLIDVKNL